MKRHALRHRYGRAVTPLMPDMSWLYGTGPSAQTHDLHERVALALGWTPAEARSMSLPSLREAVRHVNPGLANEITMKMGSDDYIRGERRRPRRSR
jgi:hypothetical protein